MAFEEAWRVGDDPEVKYLPGRLIFLERERPSPLLEWGSANAFDAAVLSFQASRAASPELDD